MKKKESFIKEAIAIYWKDCLRIISCFLLLTSLFLFYFINSEHKIGDVYGSKEGVPGKRTTNSISTLVKFNRFKMKVVIASLTAIGSLGIYVTRK